MADDEAKWWEELALPVLLAEGRMTYGRAIRKGYAEAGFDDIPKLGPRLLGGILRNGGTVGSASNVGHDFGISKQAASKLIDVLVIRGYVSRGVDPEDRRKLTLELTERGRAAAEVGWEAIDGDRPRARGEGRCRRDPPGPRHRRRPGRAPRRVAPRRGAFAAIGQEGARLRRIEAHHHALERSNRITTHDIVIKSSQPLRIAEASAMASRPGPSSVGPIFRELGPQVLRVLKHCGIRPGMSVGHYEKLRDDGSLAVHVGFEIGPDDVVSDIDGVSAFDLPVVRVASMMHHGPLDTLPESNEQLARWIQDSGHAMSGLSRELYLRWNEDEPAHNVTELQTLSRRLTGDCGEPPPSLRLHLPLTPGG